MKQTSVEWLVENIQTLINNGYDFHPKFEEKLIEQAKQMEKQQIIEAYKHSTCQFSVDARIDYPKNAEKYYNETYLSHKP